MSLFKKFVSSSSSNSKDNSSSSVNSKDNSSNYNSKDNKINKNSKVNETNKNSNTNNNNNHIKQNKISIQSWIFNLKFDTYQSIDAKLGSKISLNIKNKQGIQLKKGDRFFFSVIHKNKSDEIVSQSSVIQEPKESAEQQQTLDVIVQFEKIFNDPIPRSIFENQQLLSDLVQSKGSFTKISDTQLPLFLELINDYAKKNTSKKEAMNFLTRINFGENRKDSNLQPVETDNNNNNNNNNINNNNSSSGSDGENKKRTTRAYIIRTKEQKDELEKLFEVNNNPDALDIEIISLKLNLSTDTINQWFINKREGKKINPSLSTNENVYRFRKSDVKALNQNFIENPSKIKYLDKGGDSNERIKNWFELKRSTESPTLPNTNLLNISDENPNTATPTKEPLNFQNNDDSNNKPITFKLDQPTNINNNDNYNSIPSKDDNIDKNNNNNNENTLNDNLQQLQHKLPQSLLNQIQQRTNSNNDITIKDDRSEIIETQQELLKEEKEQSLDIIEKSKIKKNTIEEYILNYYKSSVTQKIYFVSDKGHPISVFSLIKNEKKSKVTDNLTEFDYIYGSSPKPDYVQLENGELCTFIKDNGNGSIKLKRNGQTLITKMKPSFKYFNQNDSDQEQETLNEQLNQDSSNQQSSNQDSSNQLNQQLNQQSLNQQNSSSSTSILSQQSQQQLQQQQSFSQLQSQDNNNSNNNTNNDSNSLNNNISNKENDENNEINNNNLTNNVKDSIVNLLNNVSGKKEISYGHLLNNENIENTLVGDEVDEKGIPIKYDPTFLDNSELKTGKHRTVMNLQSYKISIFPFIRKGAIKEELNEQFRQKHQWISQPGITLYKIRKIKRKLKKISIKSDLEISSLGLSYVLLEKLLLKNLIEHSNFELIASVCLLLAAKFNDPKALESNLGQFFVQVENRFNITKKELLQHEFQVFSQLSFGLFVSHHDVLPHLTLIINESRDDDLLNKI